jgi:hypothetical protein
MSTSYSPTLAEKLQLKLHLKVVIVRGQAWGQAAARELAKIELRTKDGSPGSGRRLDVAPVLRLRCTE